ncbi:phosphatidylcholine transfer protein-like isoform X2 [Lytechinus variegatus]|uniref:phosphatidylcholine transfer protein-like isoform X2 n=1 Tax=Lytechinus variegatus TaxID=7654 RepID=UPI001BB16A3D|nr:phosphatidylcholine transfer protein-like isoform X2 [Lytechinus variegatus]
MFSDEEFERYLKELDDPDLSEFEFFTESTGVKIYRRYNKTSGLYDYKTMGGIDVPAETCFAVYTDLQYRKTWDSYVKELYEFKENDRNGVYWRVAFPFPLSNRDYVFVRETREYDRNGKHIYVCLGRSAEFPSKKEKSGVVRVNDFLQSMIITSDGNGTKAFMHYYDNPRGMIPTWVINWAAKSGIPGFLDKMVIACKSYDNYLASKKR